jgi:hypothetical protein
MKRRLLNALTVLSLLLCVAVAVLWVRSYWTVDSGLLLSAAGCNGSCRRTTSPGKFIRTPWITGSGRSEMRAQKTRRSRSIRCRRSTTAFGWTAPFWRDL